MDINEIRNRILNEAEVIDYDDMLMDIENYCGEIKLAVDRLVHGIEYTKKLPSDFVFDENKSVKWNREMVIETNKRIDEKRNLRFDVEFVGGELIREALINHVVDYYNFSIKSAEIIYNNMMFIYGHCDIDIMIENLENIADICESVIESEKNKEK